MEVNDTGSLTLFHTICIKNKPDNDFSFMNFHNNQVINTFISQQFRIQHAIFDAVPIIYNHLDLLLAPTKLSPVVLNGSQQQKLLTSVRNKELS